jgi:hypothetical protein
MFNKILTLPWIKILFIIIIYWLFTRFILSKLINKPLEKFIGYRLHYPTDNPIEINTCHVSGNKNYNKFEPYNVVKWGNPENIIMVISSADIQPEVYQQLLDTIPKYPINLPFNEIAGYRVNFKDPQSLNYVNMDEVDRVVNYVYNEIQQVMAAYINANPLALSCSSPGLCQLDLYDYKIFGIGKRDKSMAYDLQLIIKIDGKAKMYVVRAGVIVDTSGNRLITSLELQGFLSQSKSETLPGYQKEPYGLDSPTIYKNNQLTNYNAMNTYYINSNESRYIVPPESITEKILDNRAVVTGMGYRCYDKDSNTGKIAYTQLDCERSNDNYGRYEKPGVWDIPCKYNIECPFYKANKNYPNEFGGCVDGFCEMPIGVKLLGVHKYTNEQNAICRNCKEKDYFNDCCKLQQDPKQYPNLITPDYAFKNDTPLRLQYANELKEKGLDIF